MNAPRKSGGALRETLTVGSLFSGIGGLELGLERAGMKVVWQVEKDEYCRKVLAKHWPDVPKYEDVKDVGKENLAPVDLICGGFPCQDISYAGKGAGLAGERSGLWYELARIVGEMGPRLVVVENVPALLTRGLGDVLGTLADLGYDAEWECVSAASVGAAHVRNRTFIVAYNSSHGWGTRRPRGSYPGRSRKSKLALSVADSEGQSVGARLCPGEPEALGRGRSGDSGCAADMADATNCGNVRGDGCVRPDEGNPSGGHHHRFRAQANDSREWWSVEPSVGRVAYGVPSRVDRLRALGNAVVPQVAELIGRWIVEADEAQEGAA